MKNKNDNILDKKPFRNASVAYKTEENGKITLEIENKGFFNKIAQRFFKRPKISYVHLDDMGSFVWPLMDGNKTLEEIGELVEEKFGEEAHPLYPRLAQYLKILESYCFIGNRD